MCTNQNNFSFKISDNTPFQVSNILAWYSTLAMHFQIAF